jgi:putative transport protein
VRNVLSLFEKNPEIAVFLAIGVGYWIGQFKFKGVGFGPVTGSLLAGLAIGAVVHVPVSDTAKQLLFLMFMYGIGFSAGPGFIHGIREGGWRWIALGFLVPATGILTACAMARVLGLELGYAAGMASGGLTESPIIGTASEAIRALPLPEDEKNRLISQIPIADALTYIFGTFGVIFFCAYIGPWLLRIDLKAEALKLEEEMGFERQEAGVASALQPVALRAYRLEPGMKVVGKTIAAAEDEARERVFVERVRRGTEVLEARPELVLEAGDLVAVMGRSEVLVRVIGERASEVHAADLLDMPTATFDIVVTNAAVTAGTLGEMRRRWRGVFVRSIRAFRPRDSGGAGDAAAPGDVVTVYGVERTVREGAPQVGQVLQLSSATDYVAAGTRDLRRRRDRPQRRVPGEWHARRASARASPRCSWAWRWDGATPFGRASRASLPRPRNS